MTTIELTVELARERDPIAGRLRARDGTSRQFTGYVGLMAELDGFLAREREARRPEGNDSPHEDKGSHRSDDARATLTIDGGLDDRPLRQVGSGPGVVKW